MNELLLTAMLSKMDVPSTRLDISKPSNVTWLLRNLAFRNGNHPDFLQAIDLLKKINKVNIERIAHVRSH